MRNVSGFSGKRRRPSTTDSTEPLFVGTIATYTTERVIGSIVGGQETQLTETDEGVQVETFEEEDNITQVFSFFFLQNLRISLSEISAPLCPG